VELFVAACSIKSMHAIHTFQQHIIIHFTGAYAALKMPISSIDSRDKGNTSKLRGNVVTVLPKKERTRSHGEE
jgi:hypothetical protein